MNSEFQIIRWGIPGWIAALTYFVFKMSLFNFDFAHILSSLQGPAITGIATLFVALGVPFGYIIYQVYFFIKWRFGNQSAYMVIEGINEFKFFERTNARTDWEIIEINFDRYMSVYAFQKDINYKDLTRQYTSYSNRTSRTHGLGATFLGMIIGFGAFILIDVLRGNYTLPVYYFCLLIIAYWVSLWAIWSNYVALNKSTFKQLNTIMKQIDSAPKKMKMISEDGPEENEEQEKK